MGLFSFVKAAGKKILTKSTLSKRNKSRSDKEIKDRQEGMLEAMIYNAGLRIQNLDVELSGNTVIVYGETEHARDRETAILILGNVDGVAEVDDRISVTVPEPEMEFYEVQEGDSLSRIAKKYYGDPLKYHILFEANRHIIDDPNLIFPGQKIRIPAVGE